MSQNQLTHIVNAQQSWDTQKKEELIALGKGPKTYAEILVYLENEIHNSKRMTHLDYKIQCFKTDGIYQLHKAIEENIGATSVNTEGPSGEKPVNTVDIILANGVRKKVPYGKIDLPGMGEDANIDISYDASAKLLYVRGKCQMKFQTLIDKIMERTKQLLNTDSIYKNQAIEINESYEGGQPKILDLSSVKDEVIILSEETEYELSSLKARILHTDKCRKNGIPLKFGCIFEGPYGTGKTLLAFKLAEMAVENNWSFIYLKSPHLLADTLRMSKTIDKNGNGIIVFVEDIDQVTRGERDNAMQDILNTLDGGDTKNMNVISLFTTNHIELIEPTFLRGKRIGSIISFPFLNASTARQYVEHFCKDVKMTGDLEPVYQLIEQSNIAPAFMAEIVENVKSNMIIRGDNEITDVHLRACVKSYLRQVQLSKTKDTTITPEMQLADSLKKVIHGKEYFEEVEDVVEKVVIEHS